MNTQFSRFSPRLVLAALALSMGLGGAAFAMPAGAEGQHPHAAMHHQQRAHGMQDMARLHDDLKLDARQEALWNDAVKAGKETMAGLHERMRKERAETLAMLNQPGTDLRAVVKRMDERKADAQKQHAAARDPWLAVYDALTAEQKEKARVFLKNQFERKGRGGHMQRGHHGTGRG